LEAQIPELQTWNRALVRHIRAAVAAQNATARRVRERARRLRAAKRELKGFARNPFG
jgi:hypothetical protein